MKIFDVNEAKLANNLIVGNRSGRHGGGIHGSTISTRNVIAGNVAEGDGGGIYGGGNVTGNTIFGNTASGEYIFREEVFGKGGAVYWAGGTLSNNTIVGNTSPSSTIYWAPDGESTFGGNNVFANDAPHTARNVLPNTEPDADFENNWWGTTDEAEIAAQVFDLFDDISLGIVDFTPFLTEPNTNAPVSPPLGLTAVGDSDAGTIALAWTGNPEADIAGYRVYYDSDAPGFPYEGTGAAEGDSPIDVGDVTGFTFSGLNLARTYRIAVTAYDTDGNERWFSQEAEVVLEHGVDSTPPYTSGHDPVPGATGVPVDTDVVVHVRDDGAGVDQASIVLTVDGVDVTGQSVATGGPDDYTVTYDPPGSFDFGREVSVTVDSTDLASPPNAMSTETYAFTTVALGAIRGNVFLQGSPDHSGVTVRTNGNGATSAEDGSYSIEGLPPGSYALTAEKEMYLTATKEGVVVEPGETAVVGNVILLAGDLNGDGVIDLRDLVILAQNLGLLASPW